MPEMRSIDPQMRGYGLRLSWPAQGSRRSIEHLVQQYTTSRLDGAKDTRFINAFMADVELFYLQDPQFVGQ